jgi:RNA recognition motif-containing protein
VNIFVGNLSLNTTVDELREEFKEFGEVISVTIMDDRYIGSGQPRCYGYVEMASKDEGTAAIASLEGKQLRDRTVNLIEALPLTHQREKVTSRSSSNNRSNIRKIKR